MTLSIGILGLIVIAQVVIRCVYAYRLLPDTDYCMYSQYDVVVEKGGSPGVDFELCWGSKIASYMFCRWARRLLPFGIYSPRIGMAMLHGLNTILVYVLVSQIAESETPALIAAGASAVMSSLIHTGSQICSPENFDIVMLPALCLSTASQSAIGATIAGGLLAVNTGWSKLTNAIYVVPVALIYLLNQRIDGLVVFLLAFGCTLGLTLLHYRLSAYYRPFLEIFRDLFQYATRTMGMDKGATAAAFHINLGSVRSLWKNLLREMPLCLPCILFLPDLLFEDAPSQAVAIMTISALMVMVVQNKLWPLHFFPAISMLAVVAGLMSQYRPMTPIIFFLGLVSLYHLVRPLFIRPHLLSRYFWYEPGEVMHYASDEASLQAADWIKAHHPDTQRVFCWGMQTQLYTHLELIGPTPIQHFSKESLALDWRQAQIKGWLRQSPPDFIFFCDPYFNYFPMAIIEGLTGCEYQQVAVFGELGFPLFHRINGGVPQWKQQLFAQVGLDHRWADFLDPFFGTDQSDLKISEQDILHIQKKGIQSVYLYGNVNTQMAREAMENSRIRVLGIVESRPSKRNGITAIDDVPFPFPEHTGFVILARSYNSIFQIRKTLGEKMGTVPVFSILDEQSIVDQLRRLHGTRGLTIYGLGAAGRYILDLCHRIRLADITYFDRMNRIGTATYVPVEKILKGAGSVFLGGVPSTNIQIYFSLVQKGIDASRCMDFGAFFGRSCLPGRLDETTLNMMLKNRLVRKKTVS
jgi:hypothetical protein